MDERCTSIREMLATARATLRGGQYTPLGMQRSVIPTSATERRIGGPGTLCFKARGLYCEVLGHRGVVFERQYSLGLHPMAAPEFEPRLRFCCAPSPEAT
jgi:hypothetical protein